MISRRVVNYLGNYLFGSLFTAELCIIARFLVLVLLVKLHSLFYEQQNLRMLRSFLFFGNISNLLMKGRWKLDLERNMFSFSHG